jgi:uncharacterized membrane protein
MTLYSTVVFLHVVTAILGLGPLTVLAVISGGPVSHSFPKERFVQLLRLVGWSLPIMFVTGAIAIAFTRGALGETGWMRASFVLFLFFCFLHAMARRQIRRAQAMSAPALPTKALRVILWSMCTVTAAITYLMEAKPF